MKITYRFEVYHPGELAAGLRSFSETIDITLHNGDTYDEEFLGEFVNFCRENLSEFFDGANVTYKRIRE